MAETIRVSVKNDPVSGIVIDTGGKVLPPKTSILMNLTRDQQSVVKKSRYWESYSYTLQRVIADTINTVPLQAWANAIGAALIFMHRQEGEAVAEQTLKTMEDMYISAGDAVYRLYPVEVVDTNKALAVARKKAKEKSEAEAKKVLEEAQVKAKQVTESASSTANALLMKAARIKEEIDQMKGEMGAVPNKELLTSGYAFRCQDPGDMFHWEVCYPIPFAIDRFDYQFQDRDGKTWTYSWAAKQADAIEVRLWTRFDVRDGQFSVTGTRVDKADIVLPHINYGGACMSCSMAPKEIKTVQDVRQLAQAVEGAMNVVVLNSLYTSTSEWMEPYKQFIPDDLYSILNSHRGSVFPVEAFVTDIVGKVKAAKKNKTPLPPEALFLNQGEMESEATTTWTTTV